LLLSRDKHSLQLAEKIIGILYKVIFVRSKYGEKQEALLRFDYCYAKIITKKVAKLAGKELGIQAINIFDVNLKSILDQHQKLFMVFNLASSYRRS